VEFEVSFFADEYVVRPIHFVSHNISLYTFMRCSSLEVFRAPSAGPRECELQPGAGLFVLSSRAQ